MVFSHDKVRGVATSRFVRVGSKDKAIRSVTLILIQIIVYVNGAPRGTLICEHRAPISYTVYIYEPRHLFIIVHYSLTQHTPWIVWGPYLYLYLHKQEVMSQYLMYLVQTTLVANHSISFRLYTLLSSRSISFMWQPSLVHQWILILDEQIEPAVDYFMNKSDCSYKRNSNYEQGAKVCFHQSIWDCIQMDFSSQTTGVKTWGPAWQYELGV